MSVVAQKPETGVPEEHQKISEREGSWLRLVEAQRVGDVDEESFS